MDGAGDDDDTESPDTRDDYDDSASLPELVLSSNSDDGEDHDERSPRQMTIVKSSVAPPLNDATLTYGDTCSIAPFVDSLPSAWVSCTLLGVKRVLCRTLLYRNTMTTVLTISLPSTLLYPFTSMCDSQQDKDNVSAPRSCSFFAHMRLDDGLRRTEPWRRTRRAVHRRCRACVCVVLVVRYCTNRTLDARLEYVLLQEHVLLGVCSQDYSQGGLVRGDALSSCRATDHVVAVLRCASAAARSRRPFGYETLNISAT
jgi:hypothetical protein